jgi:serine phosphatase RsbU (regulator of sigma subunit)
MMISTKYAKPTGIVMIATGSLVFLCFTLLFLLNLLLVEKYFYIPVLGIILSLSGIPLLFWTQSHEKREKVIFVLNCIWISLLIIAGLLKYFQLPASGILITVVCLILTLSSSPLIFLNKYERWKYYARAPKRAMALSLTDLYGKTGLIVGFLFKIMHWPGANDILIFGGVLFILSYLIWSREFQKEVVLRKEAENKLNESLQEITRQKVEIEEKNEELNQLVEEVTAQKEEIEVQRDIANEQKAEIIASITYAKRIQEAVLPANEYINEILPEHFILFKPQNIVSGDFYWIKQIKNFIVVAAADCTGHGVPGAFMSMLGMSFLTEIVTARTLDSSGEILNKLRQKIKNSLKQAGKEKEQKDGMDMAFYIINTESLELQFSGAYNPLYIIRDNEILTLGADRQPLAIHIIEKEFTTHKLQLEKGDCLYSFSDGFVDQFGGENNSKFMTKNFKKMLLSINQKPMHEQRQILDNEFVKWQGNHQQIDDVLVIGVRI